MNPCPRFNSWYELKKLIANFGSSETPSDSHPSTPDYSKAELFISPPSNLVFSTLANICHHHHLPSVQIPKPEISWVPLLLSLTVPSPQSVSPISPTSVPDPPTALHPHHYYPIPSHHHLSRAYVSCLQPGVKAQQKSSALPSK